MKKYLLFLIAIFALGLTSFANLNAQMLGQVTYPIGSGGGGGSGIPQGGPLTQDLNGGGFAINNLDGISSTGAFYLSGIYSNGSSLYLSGDLYDQNANSFESLFNGTGTTFNIESGQVQGEFDAYFLYGGDGGLSTTGQVVATTGLQVLGGTTSLDGGLIITDGNGNLIVGALNLSSNPGLFAEDFNGSSGSVVMTDGDASNLQVSGNLLSVLFNGTGELVLDSVAVNEIVLGGFPINGVSNDSSTTLLMTDGDASNCTVSGNPLSGIFDSTGNLNSASITIAGYIQFSNGSVIQSVFGSNTGVPSSDGSGSGIAAFQPDGSLAQAIGVNMKPTVANTFSGTGTATTSFVVSIGSTLANTNYTPVITPRNTLSSAVFNVSAKTTTTFTVTYLTGLTGTVAFDWALIPW